MRIKIEWSIIINIDGNWNTNSGKCWQLIYIICDIINLCKSHWRTPMWPTYETRTYANTLNHTILVWCRALYTQANEKFKKKIKPREEAMGEDEREIGPQISGKSQCWTEWNRKKRRKLRNLYDVIIYLQSFPWISAWTVDFNSFRSYCNRITCCNQHASEE